VADVVPGTLFVVATPLGNLDDVTDRAARTLREVDLIAAEDTRRTAHLLNHLGIAKPQVSCHKFNEAQVLERIVAELLAGKSVAQVTDGGTPAISDPGHRLVAAARAAGIAVSPIPGPSAVAAALSVAGFPADRFTFAGFLSAKAGERRRELAEFAPRAETLVFHEAPHRLAEFLRDAAAVLGDRPATLCRELTKLHEEIVSATLGELAAMIEARGEVLGEIVVVVAGAAEGAAAAPAPRRADPETEARWKEALEREDGDERRALRRYARDLDLPRAEARRRLQLAGLVD